MKKGKRVILFVFCVGMCLWCKRAEAQSFPISGRVVDAAGNIPLIGAIVKQEGTKNMAVTDRDGCFSLETDDRNKPLDISYMGYKKTESEIDKKSDLSALVIKMYPDGIMLKGTVVTALGIKRKTKSLGYSVANIDGDVITENLSGNWLNALNGKVAGLEMLQTGSGPTSSVRVTLRGDRSLNYGSNEALFVVDGVPISSGGTSTGSGSSYSNGDAPIDFGNDISQLNPEDIASVTVLKGASAAALYGSRAANGVILITTKGGRLQKGLGITVNSSVQFDKAMRFPDFQKEYGPGSDNGASPYSFWTLSGAEAADGQSIKMHDSSYSFGEKFDPSQYRYLYASKNWDSDKYTPLPWKYQDDWYKGIFKTGVTCTNTVTISGNNGKGTTGRLSFTDENNHWILPNTGYRRDAVSWASDHHLNQYIKISSRLNYILQTTDNTPAGGYGDTNPLYDLVWGENVNQMQMWKDEYNKGRFNEANYSSSYHSGGAALVADDNPYRTLYEELNASKVNRVYGQVNATATLYKGLTLALRTGIDWTDQFRTQQKPFLSSSYLQGFYREQSIRKLEYNTDFLLSYHNDSWFGNRLSFNTSFGGNERSNYYYSNKISLGKLEVDGVYNLNNYPADVIPDIGTYRSKKLVNSLYGLMDFGWNNSCYLDVTARNDWSSTLSRNNWSFFYPSVSTSILLDQILGLHDSMPWIDLLKVRASWANVGNDTSPYSLLEYYGTTQFPGGYDMPSTILNKNIKPERTESWEGGVDTYLFRGRVKLDFTMYLERGFNQILSIDRDPITGASGEKINAGELQDKGIEISASFIPVETRNLTWSFNVNWATNHNKLVKLQDGWDPSEPLQTDMGATIGSRTYVYSYVGHEMYELYGRGYQRAPKGAYYLDVKGNKIDCSGAKLVQTSDGMPVLDASPTRRIGKITPDWQGGMTQTLRYKNLTLSADFSAQVGGHCFSVTNFALSYQGKLKNSLAGRDNGLTLDGVNAIQGADGTITYQKNTTPVNSIVTYYNKYVLVRNNTEENTFSTDFFKCREVRLDYAIPEKLLRKSKVLQGAHISAWVTNLFCITPFPQYDPETGMLNGTDVHAGIETMAFPMTRSYGLDLMLSF